MVRLPSSSPLFSFIFHPCRIFFLTPFLGPGRFFAVNELKVMFAHILMNYDVKFEDGIRPLNRYFDEIVMPDTSAQVMFRKQRI